MDRNFLGAPAAVRPDSTTMGFADFALTLGPGGNVLALWQEMSAAGSDAHYRVYDPASNTWGLDTLLSNDAALARSFAPVWDAAGNLVLAYNNVAIVKQGAAQRGDRSSHSTCREGLLSRDGEVAGPPE